MIEISFMQAELAFLVAWIAIRVLICLRRGAVDWRHEALLVLMYVNLAVIIRFSFFPLATDAGRVQPLVFDASRVFPLRMNLVPFKQLLWYDTTRDLIINLAGNVAMFIPTGIIMPIIWPGLDRAWKAIGAGMLIPLCIELCQLPFAARASDVDDLILNATGIALGYAIYALARRARPRS